MDSAPHFYARDRETWRAWLEENHHKQNAVWLVFDKGNDRTMSWQDIVEEALCFGWIDSRPGKVSETQSKIYISKRKPRSVWSKINKQNVQKLVATNLMQPAGLEAVRIAKDNGSWQALELSDNLVYPPELAELFAQHPLAREHFEAFPVGSRRNTLQWIYDTKTAATRQKRVGQVVEAAEQGQRLR